MTFDEQEQDRDSTEAWQTARKYAFLYGEVPSSFTTLIRSLSIDQEKEGGYSSGSKWQLLRLLQAASMKAPFYFALKTFLPEALDNSKDGTLKELVHAFQPSDAACFLGLLYLFRRARRLSNSDEFERLTQDFHTRLEVGGHVGLAIPNIGFPIGILSAGLPVLARAAFLIHDREGFAAYRRQCKIAKTRYDCEYEFKRWGCTHAQIASNIAIAVGLSVDVADALAGAMRQMASLDERRNRAAYAAQLCRIWIDALLEEGKEPAIVHSGSFYPSQAALERLLMRCVTLREHGSAYRWLEKGKDSVNPDEMPELFT